MNHDRIIRLTNRVALLATVALFYWVFIFLVITTFDLKIFREHITQIFYLSVLGIFAVLGGAMVLNIMSNLSKISGVIAEKKADAVSAVRKVSKFRIIAAALSFPIICGTLFAGDMVTAELRKDILVQAARSLIAENQAELAALARYEFSKEYALKAGAVLNVIKKTDKHFPEVVLILPDNIDGKRVFLGFQAREYPAKDKDVAKHQFIFSASHEDRSYLDSVFNGREKNDRFNYNKGYYELYFPTQAGGKTIVLYFSDFQRYGKFGS